MEPKNTKPPRLIDAAKLLTWFNNHYDDEEVTVGYVSNLIKEQPTVDAVRHGRWLTYYETEDGRSMRCSECRMVYWIGSGRDGNYCPNCGAKMDAGEE